MDDLVSALSWFWAFAMSAALMLMGAFRVAEWISSREALQGKGRFQDHPDDFEDVG